MSKQRGVPNENKEGRAGRRQAISLLPLVAGLSCISMVVMVITDYRLGERAEFLNAFSVLERILGREPVAGASTIAERFGAGGELLCVVFANLVIGVMIAVVVRARRRDDS